MVEKPNKALKTETHFVKEIPKVSSKTGKTTGSWTVEVKETEGNKYIQLTQVKLPYGTKPYSSHSVTLELNNQALKDAINEAFDN